ncbi:MAG: hypothetical protein IPL60_13685 [Ardenticatenia bacterium]|nr:hypothetical protein [Ardenticatenia bacterium]
MPPLRPSCSPIPIATPFMPTRILAWLEAQPKGRRRLYSALIALTLVTLPCYAGGAALRVLDVRPPAAPVPMPTPDDRPTPTASATSRIIPTVAAPPTWTVVWQPPEEEPETPQATLEPGAPTPEPTATLSASVTPEAPIATAMPTTAATAEPTAAPTAEPPTTEPPTAPPEPPVDPPTPIGGFTPQPVAP